MAIWVKRDASKQTQFTAVKIKSHHPWNRVEKMCRRTSAPGEFSRTYDGGAWTYYFSDPNVALEVRMNYG